MSVVKNAHRNISKKPWILSFWFHQFTMIQAIARTTNPLIYTVHNEGEHEIVKIAKCWSKGSAACQTSANLENFEKMHMDLQMEWLFNDTCLKNENEETKFPIHLCWIEKKLKEYTLCAHAHDVIDVLNEWRTRAHNRVAHSACLQFYFHQNDDNAFKWKYEGLVQWRFAAGWKRKQLHFV